ncbi:MAG: isopenicillin N synthase-like dioxygenase [Candidatus Azotimanducaceae bacterium]|jgi:isopenicillin N synthase-like dioxygenase
MPSVPLIDLAEAEGSKFDFSPMDEACRQHGFFLLKNHGMDHEIEEMWKLSKQFFDLPASDKRKISRDKDSPLGYYDRELTKQKRDLKEVFDFMQPRDEKDVMNQWPEGNDEFRATMIAFFDAASVVAARTLSVVYKSLRSGVVSDASLPKGSSITSNARLNCYPTSDPLDKAEGANVAPLGEMALHHHTDPGILTLLLQDMTGGLQAHSRTEGWIDVPPESGTIVVNLGDAMQVWTNDKYRSAVHRVLPRDTTTRYSTPYFFSPERDAILEPLSVLFDEGEKAIYRSFTWKDYIQGRIDDNYADLGEEDIQIDQFKLEATS